MAPERRRVACKECRQQKVRCDMQQSDCCSRCSRLGLVCVVAPNPHARQTKAQLQKELDRLRNVPGTGNSSGHELPIRQDRRPAENVSSETYRKQPDVDTGLLSLATHHDMASLTVHGCTTQFLDGHEVDGAKIGDCLKVFLEQYHPMLSVVDPTLTPNEIFDKSPFLFWTIMFLGSRRHQDPALVLKLSSRINSMALQSLEDRVSPLETIQGLLLLCVWPVPINTMQKDMSNILSGAAIHLAMQTGLHVVGSGQDFARVKVDSRRDQVSRRAEIWAHCLIVAHSTSLREGLPPLTLAGATSLGSDAFWSESKDLRVRYKMYNLMASSTIAIFKSIRDASSFYPSLSPFISLADDQLNDVLIQCDTYTNRLYAWSCRLHVLAYYFFEDPNHPNLQGLIVLYMVACQFLEQLGREEQSRIEDACPAFIERTIILAAFSILKISRSSLKAHVDMEAGEKAYLRAILFGRRSSLQDGDLAARAATIMSQLWTSESIFRRPDGQVQSLDTRVRSRLAMSVVFDCFWWWREEFGGRPSPYNDESPDIPQDAHADAPQPAGADCDQDMFSFLNDSLPDFDWAASLDFLDMDVEQTRQFDFT